MGLIVLLLALVIVAMLAQTVLKQYGMLPGPPAPGAARQPGIDDRLRNPAIEAAPVDPTMSAPAPTNPIERARGVEETLSRQVQDLDKQLDGASK